MSLEQYGLTSFLADIRAIDMMYFRYLALTLIFGAQGNTPDFSIYLASFEALSRPREL